MIPIEITTPRLLLVPATEARLRACLLTHSEFAAATGWHIPSDWPARHWDEGAVNWLLNRIAEAPETATWGARFVLLPLGRATTLIGTVGVYGPPDVDGTVEIGYGIVGHLHRRGYGSEAAAGFIHWLWLDPAVKTIIAHTLPADPASSGVLRRNGFTAAGIINRPPDGDIERFELRR
ncbi:MAG: GNAT family N-acetyltransferase [Phycisphaerales bacterium]|nr:GNAT family N-acetyltransferase [Phycisphaerales bacterium]